ncbi:hypothetical protein CASFOL_000173 [Castilleja foliolosa]|uniref:DNA-directed RNA polymerase n=1 Tax=Castilleja foliolosa TaxID=1961234 RepID=A0ABD3EQ07_9LAMI
MDGIKNAVFTDKSIRLLGKNQYTSNVESGSTRTELKHWVELSFGVKHVHRWSASMMVLMMIAIPQNNTFLLPRDILAAADHLIGLKFGMGTLDDMNHLKNKRLRSVADLLQDQFGLSLVRSENVVRGTICGAIQHKLIPTPQNLVTSTPLTTTFESFFGLHPLSQVLDRTNPLTKIVHGRKLSYLGPGGLTGRTASFRIRDIHPSHYGRIFPIDTSEGINVGLIGSLAIHARMGHWGSLESPFYEISERSAGLRLLYLSPGRDEYYMLAAENSLALNQDIQEEQVVPARYRQEFLTIAWERVHLRKRKSNQLLYFGSIGSTCEESTEHSGTKRERKAEDGKPPETHRWESVGTSYRFPSIPTDSHRFPSMEIQRAGKRSIDWAKLSIPIDELRENPFLKQKKRNSGL